MANSNLEAHVRKLTAAVKQLQEQASQVEESFDVQDQLAKIPGRRVFHTLVGTQSFTSSNDGAKGSPITFSISQAGPFIMTHYPIVAWKVNAPSDATNFGLWRPVYSWPLADQVQDNDVINISYEMADDGSNRNFQNEIAVPGLLTSSPDQAIDLPVPTYFRPNSVISFTPTYEDIAFDTSGGTATAGGLLTVALIGYKIVGVG